MPINPDRQRMLDELAVANAETLADMAVRAADRELHGGPAQWTPPPRQATSATPRPVQYRTSTPPNGDGVPDLDAASMRRWDSWCDARIESALGEANAKLHRGIEKLAGHIGTALGKVERESAIEVASLREEIASLRSEIAALRIQAGVTSGTIVELASKGQGK
jgi:hypothetical protein